MLLYGVHLSIFGLVNYMSASSLGDTATLRLKYPIFSSESVFLSPGLCVALLIHSLPCQRSSIDDEATRLDLTAFFFMARLKSVITAEEHHKPLHILSEIDALDDDLHAQYMRRHLPENEESSP